MVRIYEPEYKKKPFRIAWKHGEIPGSSVATKAGKKACVWPANGKWFAMAPDHDPSKPYPSFPSATEAFDCATAPWMKAHESREATNLLIWKQAEPRRKERADRSKAREDAILARKRRKNEKVWKLVNADGFEVGRIVRKTKEDAAKGAARLLGFSQLPDGVTIEEVK